MPESQTTDPIRAALDAASRAIASADVMGGPQQAAAAVAAFLRALPRYSTVRIEGDDAHYAPTIATAVEEAARAR